MTAAMAFHLLLAVALLFSFQPSAAEIQETEVESDGRAIIYFDDFGFTHNGVVELNVSGISLSNSSTELDLGQLGFFLSTHDAWIHVRQQVHEKDISCALQSSLVKVVYSLDKLNSPNHPSSVSITRNTNFSIVFPEKDAGQYALLFANCVPSCHVSMTVRSAMYNLDPRTQHRTYLSVGDAALPLIYFLAYAALAAAWVAVVLRKRHTAFCIHYVMLAVLVLKALNLLCESEDTSYIERTGSAHGWDVLLYMFNFLMDISLFTLIVLIGTGWSFHKPYLQDRDKKVLMVVIPLQVVANIAQVVIDQSGPYAYLSVSDAVLPLINFLFFLANAALTAAWVAVLLRKRHTAFRIHYIMLAVLVLNALELLCESEDTSGIEDMSDIEHTGSAHGWDVLFYIFSVLIDICIFTLIVLIATGWSFLKPYLQDRGKKVLMVVVPLLVVSNIARVVIDESGTYATNWIHRRQVFLLVDVVCCCAVLFPIVWSIKNLRKAARTDGKAAVNLMKLTLFRQYYIAVICYIYFTRVVVDALVTITSYRCLWTSEVAGELATLAFYVFTGYKFRPEVHNPYFVIDDEEEEAAAEALKLDDEFEL